MTLAPDLAQLLSLLPEGLSVGRLSARLGEKPAENTLLMLGLGALLFYLAEKDRNPRVEDIWDALEYCSSSLSVGYTDVYPQTPLGKIVASAIMTFGPSMVSRVTNGPSQPDVTQEQILSTLQQILTQMRPAPAPAPAPDSPSLPPATSETFPGAASA